MASKQGEIKFPVDWDVPRPHPLSILISAHQELKNCQVKLKNQINETEEVRNEINESWKTLKAKQNVLKTLHLEFEKLESEDKKNRAKEKLDEENKLQQKIREQIKIVREEVQKLEVVQKKMEKKLKEYEKYKAYLIYAVEHNKEFTDWENVLDRYGTLCNMQTELKRCLESDLQFMIQSRNDIDDLTEEKCIVIHQLNNKLENIRIKAKAASDKLMYWETLVTTIKMFITQKTMELEMVQAATWSLYMQMCRQHKVEKPVSKSNFEEQITFIYKTILQYKQIVQISKKKYSENFKSHCPNSSVTSIKKSDTIKKNR